jgi:hypothetical protein
MKFKLQNADTTMIKKYRKEIIVGLIVFLFLILKDAIMNLFK